MLKKTATIFFLIIFIATPAIAGRGDRGSGLPHGKWWNNSEIAAQLNLSDKEIKMLDDMYVNHRRKVIKLRSVIEEQRFELNNLLDSRVLNEAAISDQAKKLEQARSTLSQERFQFFLEVRKLLGIDRYQQLKSMFQRMRYKRKHGHFMDHKRKRFHSDKRPSPSSYDEIQITDPIKVDM